MDFTLSKKHEMARTLFKEFAENEVKPLAQETDENEQFPVETVEKMAKNASKTGVKSPKIKRRDSFYDEVEISLTETLGRKVKVVNSGKKGTLEIEFYSADDLKNIANKLGE